MTSHDSSLDRRFASQRMNALAIGLFAAFAVWERKTVAQLTFVLRDQIPNAMLLVNRWDDHVLPGGPGVPVVLPAFVRSLHAAVVRR